MSVSKYRWTEACEGQPCPGDCDLCSKEPEAKNDDLISRQDAIDAFWSLEIETRPSWIDAVMNMLNSLPSAQPESMWIPVKYRPMDSEERAYWEDQFGEKLEDEDAVMFDCQMPKDGQEILVSYRKWICMDKCEIDGGCYGLEGNGDWEDVIAWMPLPYPYKGE